MRTFCIVIERGCAAAVVVSVLGAAACGSVNQPVVPDAPADGKQLRSCTAAPLITAVESADTHYSSTCVRGFWTLEALNGTTAPVAVGMPGNITQVAPVAIAMGTNTVNDKSLFAIHVSGSGQQNTQTAAAYAQLTAYLNTLSEDDVGSVDASAYTGVQFVARFSAGATAARLTVGNLFTDPAGGRCTPGGADNTNCYDNPGAGIPVSGTEWKQYKVPFDSLLQIGFGLPSPVGRSFPKNAITELKWDIGIPDTGPTDAWDLWVDDVSFYQ